MNENEERNEHFQGFAQLLWDELQPDLEPYLLASQAQDSWDIVNESEPPNLSDLEAHVKQIIAQRAYDLVYHTLGSERTEMIYWSIPRVVRYIPDLKEWPTPPLLPPFSERDR